MHYQFSRKTVGRFGSDDEKGRVGSGIRKEAWASEWNYVYKIFQWFQVKYFYCYISVDGKIKAVLSACHNKISETRWIKEQEISSHSSGSWKSQIRLQQDGEGSLHLLSVTSHGRERGVKLSAVSYYKSTNPTEQDLIILISSNSNYPLKALPPHTITLGVKTSTYEFWRTQLFSPYPVLFIIVCCDHK